MDKELEKLFSEAADRINKISQEEELRDYYLEIFGGSGTFTQLIKKLKDLKKEDKPVIGRLINKIKSDLEKEFRSRKNVLNAKALSQSIDVTIPGVSPRIGHLHIVTQAIEEITGIFERLGFARRQYPEIEWEWYSFESLNMPKDHPARDDFETYFIESAGSPKFGRMVLSPHTSSGQVREMERLGSPPIRMINIAKCYRLNWDISHTPMFHQFEGLVVDRGINITNLKGTMDYFAKQFFGENRKTRLRPFHFQFTEPSFEVDITCGICQGKGYLENNEKCRFCKEGWLELGGSGMVHPHVLRSGGIDPEVYSGFAFGWGVERTYMMKSGTDLSDIRLLYDNDLRFLEQF